MQVGNQSNVEYWFRLIYECLRGVCYGSIDSLSAFLAHIWLWIIGIGYALSVIGLFVIMYCIMRLFELRKREEEYYSTLIVGPDEKGGTHPRWGHIQSLAEGTNPSQWREAIIEADIMLDELLTKQGYPGDGVGEKLKAVDTKQLATLQNAWEAHKVRNQIAHQGSTFDLSAELTNRTIAHYEAVFREFKVI